MGAPDGTSATSDNPIPPRTTIPGDTTTTWGVATLLTVLLLHPYDTGRHQSSTDVDHETNEDKNVEARDHCADTILGQSEV
jgi:hypothetical protein